MTEPEEILELFGKTAKIIKPGLERTQKAWSKLGYPGKSIPSVLIAGTNGKGTTSGLLWHLLAAAGFKVGLFTSPHLFEFKERISVSGMEISNNFIVDKIKILKQNLGDEGWKDLTFFEINTLLALQVFEDAKVDWIVLEVGLGGRLDSTNIISPLVSVITSIGLDHSEYLGNTTDKIAMEKAGIMRPGRVCLWGGLESSDEAANKMILNHAKTLGAHVLVSGKDFSNSKSSHMRIPSGREFSWPEKSRNWPHFLKQNLSMALSACYEAHLAVGKTPDQSTAMIERSLRSFADPNLDWPVSLMGRFSELIVSQKGRVIRLLVDVCHNPHGAKALATALEESNIATNENPKPAFISILADKDACGIWEQLKGRISLTLLFKNKSPRSWDRDSVKIPGELFEDFLSAWDYAVANKDLSVEAQQPWLIFGSVAAVGEVLKTLQEAGWGLEK